MNQQNDGNDALHSRHPNPVKLSSNTLVIVCECFSLENQLALQLVSKDFYDAIIPKVQIRQKTLFKWSGQVMTKIIALIKEPGNITALDLTLQLKELILSLNLASRGTNHESNPAR